MKSSLTVIKPLKHRSKSAITNNMFQDNENFQEIPVASRENRESYDFVGPLQFRKRLLSKCAPHGDPKAPAHNDPAPIQPIQFNQTSASKNPFTSTINRNTLLSNLHKQQQIEITKQSRNIERYKQYQQMWQRKKDLLKNETKKRSPLLMENTIKSLYVHPNEQKIDVINDFIVHYWEMSLRNHHPILERHIKGHPFGQVEKEKLLQLREGTRRIEESIPALPMQKLARLKHRDLSVSGRNKVKREIQTSSELVTTRYSIPNTARLNQEQVYKISYQGDKRWMGTQNL